jgi:hypothetical protein
METGIATFAADNANRSVIPFSVSKPEPVNRAAA